MNYGYANLYGGFSQGQHRYGGQSVGIQHELSALAVVIYVVWCRYKKNPESYQQSGFKGDLKDKNTIRSQLDIVMTFFMDNTHTFTAANCGVFFH